MYRTISRVFASLVWAFVLALLSPSLVKACECTSSPTCSGTYCYCTCHVCADLEPKSNPCNSAALEYNASPAELSAFKERIDTWSEQESLRTLVEAATELYDSVLLRDSQGFIEARERFQKVINSLPEEVRRDLFRSEPRQVHHK